jgi:hypothetical protein
MALPMIAWVERWECVTEEEFTSWHTGSKEKGIQEWAKARYISKDIRSVTYFLQPSYYGSIKGLIYPLVRANSFWKCPHGHTQGVLYRLLRCFLIQTN